MVRTVALVAFESVCLLCALFGIWLIYPPAAFIVGGLIGAAGAEHASSRRRPTRRGTG
jgi:hypothetical protein